MMRYLGTNSKERISTGYVSPRNKMAAGSAWISEFCNLHKRRTLYC